MAICVTLRGLNHFGGPRGHDTFCMRVSKATKIQYQGRNISGTEMSFRPTKEDWNEYQLEDGSVVKLRLVVSDIVKTKEKTPEGQPLVVVKSAMLVIYREKGKKDAGRAGRGK